MISQSISEAGVLEQGFLTWVSNITDACFLWICVPGHISEWLTNWGPDKMDIILQIPFSNAFSSMKSLNLNSNFTEVYSQGSNISTLI